MPCYCHDYYYYYYYYHHIDDRDDYCCCYYYYYDYEARRPSTRTTATGPGSG